MSIREGWNGDKLVKQSFTIQLNCIFTAMNQFSICVTTDVALICIIFLSI